MAVGGSPGFAEGAGVATTTDATVGVSDMHDTSKSLVSAQYLVGQMGSMSLKTTTRAACRRLQMLLAGVTGQFENTRIGVSTRTGYGTLFYLVIESSVIKYTWK